MAQTQVCPALRYFEAIAPATAASRSASSKTMKGALPPSSRLTFFTVDAHCDMSSLPTSVDPVNDSLRTVGFEVSSAPIGPDGPVMTLTTPGGMPARSASSASARAENGVCDAGRMTTGQPAARAGAHLRVIIAAGKFHGVIDATTPMGCFSTTMRRPGRGWSMTSP